MGKNSRLQRSIRRAPARAGFSIVEVTILAVLLLVALGGLSGAVLSSLRLARTTEAEALADEAARAQAARMQIAPFRDLFELYNSAPGDDPNGPGTAPGADFEVRGLAPRRDDPDGMVGRIVFPSVDMGGGVQALREDVVEPRLGMDENGRDLNGNGDTHDDVTADYLFLPTRLILEWTGPGGDRSYELDLLLAQ